ncbi:MAG: PAS domain-containing protein [Paracoccaceae bacterium]
MSIDVGLTDGVGQDNQCRLHTHELRGAEVMEQDAEKPKVISILSRRKTMIFSALSQVEGYWEALREDNAVPPRSAINPRGIENALEYAFILECVAPGVARFRLAGMHLSDLMGMEVRGMPVTAMFTPEARKQVSNVITEVCARPQISQLALTGERSIGRPALEARMLLAPLTDDFGEVNRILGCLQSSGAVGRQPRRFNVSDVWTRILPPLAERHHPAPELQSAAFAESSGVFVHHGESKRPDDVRPALRLISNDD